MASVLVVPSRYEAFSYVTLEALSSGTPVVISDRVRIADYLDDIIGQGVEIFEFGNFNMFEAAIEKALHQKVNVDEIEKIFDKKKVKTKLLSIYETLGL